METQVVQGAMDETKQPPDQHPEDIIAAFDREAELAQELKRRHTEHVLNSRADDRPVRIERRRRPR
jgi:hypothetical protein